VCEELSGTEEGPKAHGLSRQRVSSALFAIDDAHGGPNSETCTAKRVDGIEERASRRDDVLDEA